MDTDTIVQDMPPQNLELEQQVLAWCLTEPVAMAWAVSNLRTPDFYRHTHQRLFAAICALWREAPAGVNVASASVHLHGQTEQVALERMNLLEYCGGMAYLRAITSEWSPYVDVRGAAHIERLGGQLRDLARLRDLQRTAVEIQEHIARAPGDAAGAIALAQQQVTSIAHGQALGSKLQDVSDVACEVGQWIDAERKQEAGVFGMRSGLASLDVPLQGLYSQRLVLVKGQTKFGKTTLCGQIVWETSLAFAGQDAGLILCIVLEGSKQAFLRRFVAWQARVDSRLLKPGGFAASTEQEKQDIREAIGMMHSLPLRVTDNCPDIGRIETEVRNARMRGDLLGVLIDYGQLITGGDGANQERQYANIAERLQRLSNEVGCPVIVPSQVTKHQDGSFGEKGATAWRDNCTLALHVNRGEAGMSLHERLQSKRVDIACEAARDDAPFGLVTCHGEFSCYRLHDTAPETHEEARKHGAYTSTDQRH